VYQADNIGTGKLLPLITQRTHHTIPNSRHTAQNQDSRQIQNDFNAFHRYPFNLELSTNHNVCC